MKCKTCKNEFTQYNSIQKLCFDCTVKKAKETVKKKQDSDWRKRKSELKEKTKTITDYRNDARYWFQRWIRIRDLGKTCISCQTLLTDIRDYDAGHYYNANSYPNLLFNEFNVNGQCKNRCNNLLSGNLIEYRKGIINRYGNEVLFTLDNLADDKTVRTLKKEYYIEVMNEYKKRCKDFER